MKESTLSKIAAAGAIAKGMAKKALAPNPNPQWTEYEMQSIDEWIACQGVKLDRPEAIRRLVELGLKAKKCQRHRASLSQPSRSPKRSAMRVRHFAKSMPKRQ